MATSADGLVLAHAGLHRLVELVVGRVDHHRRHVQQRDLVLRLDLARVGHQLLAVDDVDALALQREQDRRLDHVDAERLLVQAALLELDPDLLRDVLRPPHLGRHRAPHRRDAGARAARRATGS